jgi:uncharacterized protein (DUF1697 family)
VTRYVAFLRAINVGGRVVKMDDLRQLFEGLGLANVETFIASGNVVFESRAGRRGLERKIEQHLLDALGYDVATFVRTTDEVAEIAAFNPFGLEARAPGATLYVAFLRDAPGPARRQAVAALKNPVDDFALYGPNLYWLRRNRDSVTTGALLEKVLKAPATVRNMTTVARLAAKYGQQPQEP